MLIRVINLERSLVCVLQDGRPAAAEMTKDWIADDRKNDHEFV